MEPLLLKATEDTPYIILDSQSDDYQITGRSLPEDVSEYYQPVFDWLNQFNESPKSNFVLNIKLEYYNTASSKILLDLFVKLEQIKLKGCDVTVKWHFDGRDSDMQEAGEEFSEMTDVKFDFIKF